MSSKLSDHFFHKTDDIQPSPKTTVCTSGRCKKGTVKVIWLPYDWEKVCPDKYGESEMPNIRYPNFKNKDVRKYRFWLRCISRWDDVAIPKGLSISKDEYVDKGIIDYPLGLLYNPEKSKVEKISFDTGKHFDIKLYNPMNNPEFHKMVDYFQGFLSNEVSCNDFEEWFFGEYGNRIEEKVKRRRKRERNMNTDITYAKRGYWLDEKPSFEG